MSACILKAVVLFLVAFPVVEFVDIEDRLPQLHPGVLFSAVFAALLALVVLISYRWRSPGWKKWKEKDYG